MAGAMQMEVLGMSKRFAGVLALEDVSLTIPAGSFYALLGENGAGKSTLVKCMVGFYTPDQGQIVVDGRERASRTPHDAHAMGIGMVYQHFTLVPSMTVAENLVMARGELPPFIDWREETQALQAFLKSVPFRVDLSATVTSLAAGEKQKVEILKQLYSSRRFLILDEPTSVLTPGEADEVLGLLRSMTQAGELTVLMITHKFREVLAFADEVAVLRRGRLVAASGVAAQSPQSLARAMVGSKDMPSAGAKIERAPGAVKLAIDNLGVSDDHGLDAVAGVTLAVRGGEIVGIAGVSGNGQRELVEALMGQRRATSGSIRVDGAPYRASRDQQLRHRAHSLPEEPLRNACVAGMSVAENMALRRFDQPEMARGGWWLSTRAMQANARTLMRDYRVKAASAAARVDTLSGGNVQRAVLARELSQEVDLLIVANPVFGLDFAAVAEIHDRIIAARNRGTAVLLVSEDLDELLELSDRIAVMFDGRIVYETAAAAADAASLGHYMAGHFEAASAAMPATAAAAA